MHPISYHVYSSRDGGVWLTDDEQSWTSVFDEAGRFSPTRAVHLAAKMADHGTPGASHYVLAWMTT